MKIKTVQKIYTKKYGCDCYYHYNERCYEMVPESDDSFDNRINELIEVIIKDNTHKIIDIEYIKDDVRLIKYERFNNA